MGDTVAGRVAPLRDDVPAWVLDPNIVSGTCVLKRQRPASDHLVQDPSTPAEGARWLRADSGLDIGGRDHLESGGVHLEVAWLWTQREPQVRHE